MAKRHSIPTSSAAIAFFASLLLHFGALYVALWAMERTKTHEDLTPEALQTVQILSEEEVARLLNHHESQPETPPEPQPETPPEKKSEPQPLGQIVEIPPPAKEEIPDSARFVSEFNSKVDREQVAANHQPISPQVFASDRVLNSAGMDPNGNQTAHQATPQKPNKPNQSQHAQDSNAQHPANERSQTQQAQTDKQTEITSGEGPFTPRHPRHQTAVLDSGPQAGGQNAPEILSLLPNLGPKELALQIGSIDHIEDVESGNETFLNSREYKHAWFFNRIKSAVAEHWYPSIQVAHQRYDPSGQVYGIRDRITLLEISLSPQGDLKELKILKSSGVGYLDDEALAAFRKAAPFPHPPAALVDQQGLITLQFGFHIGYEH